MSISVLQAANPPAPLRQWLLSSLARAGFGLGLVGAAWCLSGLALRLEAGDDAVFGFLLLLLLAAHAAATWLLNRQVGAFLELDGQAPGSSWLIRLAASAWWVLLLLLSGALILSDVALLLVLILLICLVSEGNSGPTWFTLLTAGGPDAWA